MPYNNGNVHPQITHILQYNEYVLPLVLKLAGMLHLNMMDMAVRYGSIINRSMIVMWYKPRYKIIFSYLIQSLHPLYIIKKLL